VANQKEQGSTNDLLVDKQNNGNSFNRLGVMKWSRSTGNGFKVGYLGFAMEPFGSGVSCVAVGERRQVPSRNISRRHGQHRRWLQGLQGLQGLSLPLR
jgi:hypothetical protein